MTELERLELALRRCQENTGDRLLTSKQLLGEIIRELTLLNNTRVKNND